MNTAIDAQSFNASPGNSPFTDTERRTLWAASITEDEIGDGVTVKDIAEYNGVSLASAYSCLESLRRRGYLYRVGPSSRPKYLVVKSEVADV